RAAASRRALAWCRSWVGGRGMLSRRDSRRSYRGEREAHRPRWLAFVIGDRARALSLGLVGEVAEVGAVTRLPAADPRTLGLILHRGAVLPLVDLGRRLGAGPRRPDSMPGRLCIITRSAHPIAFPVEAVLGLRPASEEAPLELLDAVITDLARDQDPG